MSAKSGTRVALVLASAFGILTLLVIGSVDENRGQESQRQQNEKQGPNTEKRPNIDAFVRLEKLTETESKTVATRYRLELVKSVSLSQFLASDIVPRILGIGATVKLQVVSGDRAKELAKRIGPSPTPVVVAASKGEFTFDDEIIFSVYYPSAAN
jgi:hypothetical protein